jgi:AcrR family transcriptional regulator
MEDVRESIVDAAARILAAEGVRGVTTRAVAQAAGVQAPTIYRLFGDKDGLIDAVAEHVMATYVAAKPPSASTDPVADLRSGWRTHVEFGLANPGLFALLLNPDRHSPATAAGLSVLRARVRRLASAGLLRVDESLAVSMIHAAGTGTVLALLGLPPSDRGLGLADAMFAAVATQILADAPVVPDASDDVRAVAVTFATVVDDLPGLSSAERALMGEWLGRSLAR